MIASMALRASRSARQCRGHALILFVPVPRPQLSSRPFCVRFQSSALSACATSEPPPLVLESAEATEAPPTVVLGAHDSSLSELTSESHAAQLEGIDPAGAHSTLLPEGEGEMDGMDEFMPNPSVLEANQAAEMLLSAHARQYTLETKALEQNIEQYKQVIQNVIAVGRGGALPLSQRLLVSWFTPVAEAIDREQALIWSRAQGTDRITYGPYLVLLPPEKLAVITMHEVMNMILISGGSCAFTALASRVGQAVQAEISMMKLRYKDRRTWTKLSAGRTANIASVRRQARKVLEETDWPSRVHVKVGGVLIHLLLEHARIEVTSDGRLSIEKDDPHASATPVDDHLHNLQEFFLSDTHPYFPNSKIKDAEQMAARDVKVGARVRSMEEEGLIPAAVAELASLPASMRALPGANKAAAGGGKSKHASKGATAVPLTATASGTSTASVVGADGLYREWDDVMSRERVTVGAFRHVYTRQVAGKVTGMIAAHTRLLSLLSEAAIKYAHPTHFPMVVPPRPWTAPFSGGYLKQRVPVLRLTPGAKLQMDVLRQAHCPQVYAAVSVMGETPWRINGFILDTVHKVWEAGGGLADIPSRKDVPVPEPPVIDALGDMECDEARSVVMRRARLSHKHAMQANADLHSLRCDMTLKLNVADQFRDDVLYFPHNMDFRGRVYPVPPHLNHMGADMSRGMLTFATPKPLGAGGLRWLKIHISNLMGRDKVSLDEREAYTEANLQEVIDSAERPLTGNGWWQKADSPWQALAAMKELSQALACARPEEYECALPVHQDGSCNGLQHYAALGRDGSGGRAVNLVPTLEDKPQDVYSQVLRLVLAKMDADREGRALATGDTTAATAPLVPLAPVLEAVSATPDERQFPTLTAAYEALKRTNSEDMDARAGINASVRRLAAAFLSGQVDRKVVKQTVMTSVYGVTFIGARQQILSRLKEKFEGHSMPVDEMENTLFLCASYLARTTLDSLGDLFTSADAIKKWLADVARLVALSEQPMAWITPLGLPIVQPYRRERSMMVKTVLQDVVIADSSEQLPVSTSRQRSAFPPNFVHSLDSTHMMLTALDCHAKGLMFTAVHDSYWTHACDVDIMSASLREQFISLYSMPLLENFREALVQRFPDISFPPLPPRGTLDLDQVRNARYFFN